MIDTHTRALQIYGPSIVPLKGKSVIGTLIECLGLIAEKAPAVNAIYLCAFLDSGSSDRGFEVKDDRRIDPRFGTMAELATFIEEAHAADIRMIMDAVVNHVSPLHPLAQLALAGARRYHHALHRFSQAEAERLMEQGLKPLFGEQAFARIGDSYYLNTFADINHDCTSGQIDANWENWEVKSWFRDSFFVWRDYGVDGLRVDCPELIAKAFGKFNPDDPFSPYDIGLGFRWLYAAAQGTGLELWLESFRPNQHVQYIQDMEDVYLLDCSNVLSGRTGTVWDDLLVAPVLGGHDVKPLRNQGYTGQQIDQLIAQAMRQRLMMLDVMTMTHLMACPDELPGDRERDANFNSDSKSPQRYLSRRDLDLYQTLTDWQPSGPLSVAA